MVGRADLRPGSTTLRWNVFGIQVPIPQTVVHMSLFVAVLSGLHFTVSTSVDPLYRQRFFDPLITEVASASPGVTPTFNWNPE